MLRSLNILFAFYLLVRTIRRGYLYLSLFLMGFIVLWTLVFIDGVGYRAPLSSKTLVTNISLLGWCIGALFESGKHVKEEETGLYH